MCCRSSITRVMSFMKLFVTIDALAMKQPPFSTAITCASGTCAIEMKGEIERRRQRWRLRIPSGAHFSQLRIYCMRSITPRRCAHLSPRRNNRSFNSDAGSLSLSPVKCRPARFRHRSRRTFILLLVSRGVRFIIAEAMICKISPPRSFDFRQVRGRRRCGVYQVYELNCRFITLEGRGRGQGWRLYYSSSPFIPRSVRRRRFGIQCRTLSSWISTIRKNLFCRYFSSSAKDRLLYYNIRRIIWNSSLGIHV